MPRPLMVMGRRKVLACSAATLPAAASLAWLCCVGMQTGSASSEGNDSPDRIVRRNPNRDTIARHHLDAEAAHAAAQLGENLVACIALYPVQPAAVDRHDRSLNVNQIVLAQQLLGYNYDMEKPTKANTVPHRKPSGVE